MKRAKQQGTVVIIALLMVAIVAGIAVGLMTQQRTSVMRTEQIVQSRQAYYYARGSLYWAKSLVTNPLPEDQKWPIVLPDTELPNKVGQVHAQIINYSALADVNKVSGSAFNKLLTETLQSVGDVSAEQIGQMMGSISAWEDTSSTTDDDYYLALKPAYRQAHQPMVSVSELRLVKGITPQIYEAIYRSLAAMPVNSAGDYYLLTSKVDISDESLTVYSLLQRTLDNGTVYVKLYWQSLGTL